MATPAFGRLAMTRGGEMATSRTLLWEAKASPTRGIQPDGYVLLGRTGNGKRRDS